MIIEHWQLVWADLITECGFDVGDRAMMLGKTWKSLKIMIAGLVAADTRFSRKLNEGRN